MFNVFLLFPVDDASGGVDSPDAGDATHDPMRNHRRGHSSDGGGKNAVRSGLNSTGISQFKPETVPTANNFTHFVFIGQNVYQDLTYFSSIGQNLRKVENQRALGVLADALIIKLTLTSQQ